MDRGNEEAFFQVLGMDEMWKEFRKWMFPGKRTANFYNYKNGDIAAYYGYLSLFTERPGLICTKNAMDFASMSGHLGLLQWLHHNRKEGCTKVAMNWAASNGHLETVRWLHYNRKEGCTIAAINYAVGNGHLEVVRWLQTNCF